MSLKGEARPSFPGAAGRRLAQPCPQLVGEVAASSSSSSTSARVSIELFVECSPAAWYCAGCSLCQACFAEEGTEAQRGQIYVCVHLCFARRDQREVADEPGDQRRPPALHLHHLEAPPLSASPTRVGHLWAGTGELPREAHRH
ncbi:myeloid-derived growth factor isoform X7 [Myotis myotis]|uniref:myeloid-derived growth factor isoform X7 n=1 Tax=Myotis myotis TaxID=51298 RepID=UPI00174CA572|nr:myeloid-derived growth factor isoform X7 [Myotis myotis]